MAGKSDALRERYERFSRGDLEGALDQWSDDFVWDGASASELPGSGRHEGKQTAIGVLQQTVGAWDKFALTADEFIEQGDTVVVLGHTTSRRASGPSVCRSCTSGAIAATRRSAACRF